MTHADAKHHAEGGVIYNRTKLFHITVYMMNIVL